MSQPTAPLATACGAVIVTEHGDGSHEAMSLAESYLFALGQGAIPDEAATLPPTVAAALAIIAVEATGETLESLLDQR